MTEDDARRTIFDQFGVSRGTAVASFVDMVVAEAAHQNLISAATIPAIWVRHVMDSAQLLNIDAHPGGRWIDVGTGAGFPGMIIALLTDRLCTLIEPRRRRADFLRQAVEQLGISGRVDVEAKRARQVPGQAAVISARGVASLSELLAETIHLAHSRTIWVLPKGASAREEVAAAQRTWHGSFHVEQSVTDQRSLIVVAKGIVRR